MDCFSISVLLISVSVPYNDAGQLHFFFSITSLPPGPAVLRPLFASPIVIRGSCNNNSCLFFYVSFRLYNLPSRQTHLVLLFFVVFLLPCVHHIQCVRPHTPTAQPSPSSPPPSMDNKIALHTFFNYIQTLKGVHTRKGNFTSSIMFAQLLTVGILLHPATKCFPSLHSSLDIHNMSTIIFLPH